MPAVLSNRERRVIANLAIPRNVENLEHELRIDPHSPTLSVEETQAELEAAQERGWVVRIKDGDRNPGTVAARLPKKARQMPDEQARIYESRLNSPAHAWRMIGDLWVITEDGVDQLRAPVEDEAPAFDTLQLAELISLQSRAIYTQDPSKPDVVLGQSDVRWRNPHTGAEMVLGTLLPEEYAAWLDVVVKDHKARWGDAANATLKKRLPIVGGAGWTDVYENRIIDHENQKTAMPALVAPWFMCLVILALTDTDTPTTARDGTHIPTYTGYAEKSVAAADMPAASGGSSANTTAITFAACTAGSSTIVGFGNKETNGTTGDLRKYGTCASTSVSTTQTPPTFSVGAYTTSAD